MKVSTFSVRFDLENRQIFLERLNGLQEIELNSRSKLFPQLFNILLVYFHHVWAQRRKKKRLHYSSSLPCLFSPFLSAVISLHLSSSPGPPEQKAQDAAPDSVWLIEHIKAIAEVNIPLFLFLFSLKHGCIDSTQSVNLCETFTGSHLQLLFAFHTKSC